MNPDRELILSAYNDAIRKLYATLFDAYVQSGGEAGPQHAADQRFIAGIGFARKSRDRAIALVA